MPIIGSLNGTSLGGWTDYAKKIEQAGADALELNIYYIPTDLDLSGADVEQTYIDILKAVRAAVKIPVAVKLSARFSNIANMAKRLDDAGANGLVLFNRFYQPDIDLDALEITPKVLLSTPQAMRLPLRWIGILQGRLKADLAATSGIHTAEDVIKMLMVGANVTMLCSVLLKNGIAAINQIEKEMVRLDGRARIRVGATDARQHEPDSLRQPGRLRARPVHAGDHQLPTSLAPRSFFPDQMGGIQSRSVGTRAAIGGQVGNNCRSTSVKEGPCFHGRRDGCDHSRLQQSYVQHSDIFVTVRPVSGSKNLVPSARLPIELLSSVPWFTLTRSE